MVYDALQKLMVYEAPAVSRHQHAVDKQTGQLEALQSKQECTTLLVSAQEWRWRTHTMPPAGHSTDTSRAQAALRAHSTRSRVA